MIFIHIVEGTGTQDPDNNAGSDDGSGDNSNNGSDETGDSNTGSGSDENNGDTGNGSGDTNVDNNNTGSNENDGDEVTTPEVPETPETPENPEVPEVPEAPVIPEAPEVSDEIDEAETEVLEAPALFSARAAVTLGVKVVDKAGNESTKYTATIDKGLVEGTNQYVGEDSEGNKTDIEVTTTAAADGADWKVEEVTYSLDSATASKDGVTEANGKYTIAGEKLTATSSIEITVVVAERTYTVKAPDADSTNNVAWTIKGGETTTAGQKATVKKGQDVTLTATYSGSSSVKVTVGDGTDAVTATLSADNDTTKTHDFTVAAAVWEAGIKTDAPETEIDLDPPTYKAAVELTVKVKAADDSDATGFTVKYAIGENAVPNKTVSDGKITDAYVNDTVRLAITPASGKLVTGVTYGTKVTPDEGVYTIPVVAETTDIAITTDEAKTITVTKDANVKSVKYKVTGDATEVSLPADGKIIVAETATISLNITLNKGYRVVYVHERAANHSTAGGTCEGCATITNLTNVGIKAESTNIRIVTEEVGVAYKLADGLKADAAGDEPYKGKVSIVDENGTAVPNKTEEGKTDEYNLLGSKTYYVLVSDVKENEEPVVKVDSSTTLKRDANKDGYQFKLVPDTASPETAKVISVTQKAFEAAEVTFAAVTTEDAVIESALPVIKVKAEAFKTVNAENKMVAAEGAALAEKDTATVTGGDAYKVAKNTGLTFTLTPADETYAVTEVKIGEKKLTPDGNSYTIDKITDATEITIKAGYSENARNITFKNPDGNVNEVKVTNIGGTAVADAKQPAELGKPKYFKGDTEANQAVVFTVTAKAGYQIDKIVNEANQSAEDVTKSGDNYTFTFEKGGANAASFEITTKADALGVDKFVAFNVKDEGVELSIKDPADIQPEEKKYTDGTDELNVYKLTAEKIEGETVTTKEIPELYFDLSVEYGKKLDTATLFSGIDYIRRVGTRVLSADRQKWTYSYKIVANQITGETGTAEKPAVITVADNSANSEKITVQADKAYTGVLQYKSAEPNTFTDLPTDSSYQVNPGDTVILKVVGGGQKLFIDDKEEELDGNGKFSFVAQLDESKEEDTVKVVKLKAAASYQISYSYTDANDDTVNGIANKDSKIDVPYGTKVALTLQKDSAGTFNAEAISKTSKTGTKSTLAVPDQEATNVGKAELTVKDDEVSVELYATETDVDANTEKEILAGTITFTSKDASGKTLTAKGISNNGTVKLDMTSVAKYPVTLKQGKDVLDAYAYLESLEFKSSDEKVVKHPTIDEKGNLVLKTMGTGTATVTITAKDSKEELLTFKVEGQTPKLAMKSVGSVNQGVEDILLNVAASGVKTISDEFELYYEVKVSGTGTGIGTYYLSATDVNGDLLSKSQMFKVNKGGKTEQSYTFTVRLVAVKESVNVVTGTPADGKAGTAVSSTSIAAASEKAVEATFSTHAAKYENKLSVTKKQTKLYSGQQNVVVAVPKFSKLAGYINDVKAEVYNKDGSLAEKVHPLDVDLNTMEVKVNAETGSEGSYNVVIYATAHNKTVADEFGPYDMYRASAKVAITVQKGIESIDVAQKAQIAVVPDKKGKTKDVSFTLKPVGMATTAKGLQAKASSQKFTYSLVPDSVTNKKNNGYVTVNNKGKVTVSKNFIVGKDPADNKFQVKIQAADYAANTINKVVTFTVTNEAQKITDIRLKKDTKILGQTVKTTDLENAKVVVLDKNGKEIDTALLTITPNKKTAKIYVEDGFVEVNGYQKTLTIKAVTTDGGKSSLSKKFTVEYPDGISYKLDSVNVVNGLGVTNPTLRANGNTWTYYGRGNETIKFNVNAFMKDDKGVPPLDEAAATKNYNYSVKITNGKNNSGKTGVAAGFYWITPTKKDVKVEITDKKTKQKYTFSFTDTNWIDSVKAPKASTKDKLYAARMASDETMESYSDGRIPQTLKYTVNTSYKAVKLTYVSSSKNCSVVAADGSGGLGETIVPVTNGSFKLKDYSGIGSGTVKYAVVYGDAEMNLDGSVKENTFVAKTAATTLSIKVNKVGTIKAVNKYTINPNISASVKLQAKPALNLTGLVQYNEVLSANVKGEKNKFFDLFKVENGMLTVKDKAALAKLDPKKDKADLTGYLTYQYSNADGRIITKQDKITVTLDTKAAVDSKTAYTAAPINIVAANGATATTTIMLGGEAVKIAKVATDSSVWSVKVANTAANNKAEKDADDGKVTLTANGVPASGTVTLYVILKDSAVASTGNPMNDGIKVQLKVTTKAVTDGGKITVKAAAKTPTATISGSKVLLNVELVEGVDFVYNLDNAKIKSVSKASSLTSDADQKASDAIDGTPSYTDASKATNEDGTPKKAITLKLDRDKLTQNTTCKIPVNVSFTTGADEIIYVTVKTEKIPAMSDVETQIRSQLDLGLTDGEGYDSGSTAATTISNRIKAEGFKISELSGVNKSAIQVAAKTVEGQNFEDTKANGEITAVGHHTLEITLRDATKTKDNTHKFEVTVTSKKTMAEALTEEIGKYITEIGSGDTKIKVSSDTTKAEWTNTLQSVVDSVAPGKYYVEIGSFTPGKVTADGENKGKLESLTFTITLKNAKTGANETAAAGVTATSVSITSTSGTIS